MTTSSCLPFRANLKSNERTCFPDTWPDDRLFCFVFLGGVQDSRSVRADFAPPRPQPGRSGPCHHHDVRFDHRDRSARAWSRGRDPGRASASHRHAVTGPGCHGRGVIGWLALAAAKSSTVL
eukprot:447979-Rhodomonas_salina.2